MSCSLFTSIILVYESPTGRTYCGLLTEEDQGTVGGRNTLESTGWIATGWNSDTYITMQLGGGMATYDYIYIALVACLV